MGVPFDNVTSAEATALIEQMIASGRPHYLVTPNVDFLAQATRDIELRRILFDAHLVVCDGTPLVWASRLLGNPLPERVAGADLVPGLIRVAAEKGYRLFFLGATSVSVEQAIKRLRTQYPDLCIAGYYSPPFAELLEMDHDQIKQRVLDAKPDLLFVAFGCPKQEKWIAMHYRSLGVPLTAGVGGTIDFLGGMLRRAPVWMQRTGTEWVFRLAQEPRRLFRRYARDLWAFGWNILPQWWQMKASSGFRRTPGHTPMGPRSLHTSTSSAVIGTEPAPTPRPFQEVIPLPERFDLLAVRQLAPRSAKIRDSGHHWLLDMSGVKFIDSTGVGLLIQWKKLAQNKGFELVLVAMTPVVERALSLLRLEGFFLRAADLVQAKQLIAAKACAQFVRPGLTTASEVRGVEWCGEITAANTDEVWKLTRALLETDAGPGPWTIDLSNVTFLDSSGIGLMIRLKKWARQTESNLQFTGLGPSVSNVLRLAHLDEFLLGQSR
jgi:N-acetylglucosaminyldiphosphoundecaprenol N-acetyl-beta-D-mannosaminyltransferase